MEKQGVPMNQYPQSPDLSQQQPGQPPIYQDPNQPQQYQQTGPTYGGSPPPQQGYVSPQPTGQTSYMDPNQQSQYATSPGPHQGHPGMPPQQQSNVGQTYQSVTPIANLGRGPAPIDCPACGQRAMTNVMYETGNSTHAWALGLCLCLCLGCIPYLMNSLKDVQHKCGKCGVLLATWHRSGTTEVHIHN